MNIPYGYITNFRLHLHSLSAYMRISACTCSRMHLLSDGQVDSYIGGFCAHIICMSDYAIPQNQMQTIFSLQILFHSLRSGFKCAWKDWCLSTHTLSPLNSFRSKTVAWLYSSRTLCDPLSLSGCSAAALMETSSGSFWHRLSSCLGFGFARRCLSDEPRGPWDSDRWFSQR